MDLLQASRQWAERPDDQRFETLQELYAVTKGHYDSAAEAEVFTKTLKVTATDDNDIRIQGETGAEAKFTDFSFRQIAGKVGAPAGYLAGLPAELAAENLNYGLSRLSGDEKSTLLLHSNGSLVLRAALSDKYRRIWDYEVAEFALALHEQDPNWRTPPARPARENQRGTRLATAADVLDLTDNFGLSVNVGDAIAPAGLYASSSDTFIFQVNQNRLIDAGNNEVLNRGFFISNSEVGDASLRLTTFCYEHVCGNHIVWGAKDVYEVTLRHVGRELRVKVNEAFAEVQRQADASTEADRSRVRAAKSFVLGDSKTEVIDLVFQKGFFSRRDATAAYELAEQFEDIHGNPNTAWGFASGLTRLSQQTGFASKRTDMDRQAGKVLQLAF